MRDVAMLESFTARNKWKDLLDLTFEDRGCVGMEVWPPSPIPISLDYRISWNPGNIRVGKDLQDQPSTTTKPSATSAHSPPFPGMVAPSLLASKA